MRFNLTKLSKVRLKGVYHYEHFGAITAEAVISRVSSERGVFTQCKLKTLTNFQRILKDGS